MGLKNNIVILERWILSMLQTFKKKAYYIFTGKRINALQGKNLYQALYDTPELHYGDSDYQKCPVVRYMPLYQEWLLPPVIELGCGRGQGVQILRSKEIPTDGIDQIELDNGMMVGDITKPMDLSRYSTSLCIDVFEHIKDEGLIGLIENMKQTKRQVISVHCLPAMEYSQVTYYDNLHINLKTPKKWRELLSEHFNIVKEIEIDNKIRYIYLLERYSAGHLSSSH